MTILAFFVGLTIGFMIGKNSFGVTDWLKNQAAALYALATKPKEPKP
jgi:hypothetical protein